MFGIMHYAIVPYNEIICIFSQEKLQKIYVNKSIRSQSLNIYMITKNRVHIGIEWFYHLGPCKKPISL